MSSRVWKYTFRPQPAPEATNIISGRLEMLLTLGSLKHYRAGIYPYVVTDTGIWICFSKQPGNGLTNFGSRIQHHDTSAVACARRSLYELSYGAFPAIDEDILDQSYFSSEKGALTIFVEFHGTIKEYTSAYNEGWNKVPVLHEGVYGMGSEGIVWKERREVLKDVNSEIIPDREHCHFSKSIPSLLTILPLL